MSLTYSRLVIALSIALTLSGSLAAQPTPLTHDNLSAHLSERTLNGCDNSPSSLSLAQAVSRALCANTSLRAAGFNQISAAEQTAAAKMAYNPTVSATVGKTLSGKDSSASQVAIGVNWLVWDFGTRSANLEAAQASERQALYAFSAQQHALAYSVTQAYLDVQAQQALEDSAQAHVRAAQEALTLAAAREAVGEATSLDVSLARNGLAHEELTLAQVSSAKSNALHLLTRLLALPAQDAARLTVAPTDALATLTAVPEHALETLIAEASSTHPEILAAQSQTTTLRAQTKAVSATHLPTVTLSGQLQSTKHGTRSATNQNVVGVSIQIPLYSGGITSAKVRELTARSNASQQLAKGIQADIAYQISTTYQAMRLQVSQVKAATRMVESAQKAQTQTMAQYRAGVGTMLDVLDALTKSAQASSALTLAALEGQLLRAKLAWQLGLMPAH